MEEQKQGAGEHKPNKERIITSDKVRYYQWDEEMTDKAQTSISEIITISKELQSLYLSEAEAKLKQTAQVNVNMYNKLEKEAKKNWDLFYKANKTNFYKDRHYIKYEFAEIATALGVTLQPKPSDYNSDDEGEAPTQQSAESVQVPAEVEKTQVHEQPEGAQVIAEQVTESIGLIQPEEVIAETKEIVPKKQYTLLDAGCGVGNGFYPLYREYSKHGLSQVHACDFSPRAVEFAKQHELYNPEQIQCAETKKFCMPANFYQFTKQINLQVCDLVNDPQLPFPLSIANFGICLFVLSAISPENHPLVAKKLYDQLADGGMLYFRDYGRYDLAQLRLAQRQNQKLKDNFYIRSDKTRALKQGGVYN